MTQIEVTINRERWVIHIADSCEDEIDYLADEIWSSGDMVRLEDMLVRVSQFEYEDELESPSKSEIELVVAKIKRVCGLKL